MCQLQSNEVSMMMNAGIVNLEFVISMHLSLSKLLSWHGFSLFGHGYRFILLEEMEHREERL